MLEFLARVVDQIPEPSQQTVRYWGFYANAARGHYSRRCAESAESHLLAPDDEAFCRIGQKLVLRGSRARLCEKEARTRGFAAPAFTGLAVSRLPKKATPDQSWRSNRRLAISSPDRLDRVQPTGARR